MTQFAQFQQQLEWLKTQVQCIQNGDCCGGANFMTPLFVFDGATNILTSTFVDGTAIPADLSSLAGGGTNLYLADGDIGPGRVAQIVDTFTLASAGGVPLNVFNTNGNTSLAMTAGTVSMGPVAVNNAKLHIQSTTADNTARVTQIDDSNGDLQYYRLNNGQEATGINMIPNVVLRTGIHKEINAVTVGAFPLVIGERLIFEGGYTSGALKSETALRIDGRGHVEETVLISAIREVVGAGQELFGIQLGASSTVAVDVSGALMSASTLVGNQATALRLKADGPGDNYALVVHAAEGLVVLGATNDSGNGSLLQVTGDVELVAIGNSVILKRPDGTRVKLAVDNANTLTAVLA